MRHQLLCALLLCLPLTGFAKVEVKPVQHSRLGTLLVAKVSEEISPGDYEALMAGLRAHPGRFAGKILLLDSIGGSVPEALRMGRLLRETKFESLVPSEGICQGSCVYLLAAGTVRTVNGYVGLHRPYFTGGDSAQAEQAARGQGYSTSAYLRQMGVSDALLGDMQRIAPHQLKVLSPAELARYRLTQRGSGPQLSAN